MAERALSLDFDGVVFPRIPIQSKALWSYLRRGSRIYEPPNELPTVDRELTDGHLRFSERPSFLMHQIRSVPRDVADAISSLVNVDIYGNTGRLSRKPWVDLTMDALKKAGISEHFKDVFFKPEGVRTRDSKIAAVAQLAAVYDLVTHFDDNPQDALPIARRFPHVNVVIVQDLTTGILFSRKEALNYPNVRRVATFGKGISLLDEI